ncbi:MAG: uracil-DNA glycosylase [Patescibacteria group bacterium]
MDKNIEYESICKEIMGCSKCDLGCDMLDGFNPRVPGKGNLDSKIIFMAEGPGKTETEKCCPLVPPGLSGKKYEEVLKYLGLTRDKVYTTNSIHCRPPSNRDPLPWESLKCFDYVKRELALVNPEIIVTFGRFSANTFLKDFKITRDHGKIRQSENFNIKIFPLFHPAYVAAYAPKIKREEFKQDVVNLKQILKESNILI